ncbi:hypothetical protein H0H92_009006 [Tricholoma furcatifolium]|nr:hypothetical protein H0H92_009006 [Tricholoma furcatifolium]
MYALKTRAPDIQHLVITIQTSPRLWEFIVEFKNLRSLEISGIADVVIFRRLAISLKELQRLVINFLDTAPLRTSFPVIDADTDLTFPFEKLRTLVFKGKGSTVASYLVCMRGGSVGNLYLNLNTDPDSSSRFNTALEQWDTCMSVMKEHWATSLESIRLETFEKVTISMSSTFFSQLSATSLKYVEFEGKISTRDCDMLARSLPCMISLYIHLVEGPSSVSRGRFVKGTGAESLGSDIFASFATHCPNLHSMDVGFEKSFTSFSLSKSPVHAHSLATLSITSEDRLDVNNLQHAIQAARLLHRIFPFLEVLRTRDNHASTPFWVHVYELYKEFRKLSEPQDDDAVLGSFMALRKKKKKGKK